MSFSFEYRVGYRNGLSSSPCIPIGNLRGYNGKAKLCPHCGGVNLPVIPSLYLDAHYWQTCSTIYSNTYHTGSREILEDWNYAIIRCPNCGKYYYLVDALDSKVKPEDCKPEAKYEVRPLEELPVSYGNEALLQFEGIIPEEKLFCVRRAVAIHHYQEIVLFNSQRPNKLWRRLFKEKPFSSEYLELYEKNEAAILSSDATFPAMVMLKADILRQQGRFDECIEHIDKHLSKLGHFLIDRCSPIENYLLNPEGPIPSLQECLANVQINVCKGYRSLLNQIKELAKQRNSDVVKLAVDSWVV